MPVGERLAGVVWLVAVVFGPVGRAHCTMGSVEDAIHGYRFRQKRPLMGASAVDRVSYGCYHLHLPH